MNARNLSIFNSDGVFGNDRIPRISDGELAAKAQATLQNYETNMKLLHGTTGADLRDLRRSIFCATAMPSMAVIWSL